MNRQDFSRGFFAVLILSSVLLIPSTVLIDPSARLTWVLATLISQILPMAAIAGIVVAIVQRRRRQVK